MAFFWNKKQESKSEEVTDLVTSLTLDMEDEELVSTIDTLVSESSKNAEAMEKLGEDNEKYWKGHQLDPSKFHDHQTPVNDNRIFLSTETVIPIMTSRTPEPTVRLKDAALREQVKQFLMNLWEVPTDDCITRDMQAVIEMVARHWMIYRIGIIKYFYDPEIDGMRTIFVRPPKVIFDKEGTTVDDCRFIGEYADSTVDGLFEEFPKKEKEITEVIGKNRGMSKIKYLEFWTDEYVCYKFKNIILEKKKNPNFDYGDLNGTGKPIFNIFKKARKPYIVLNLFNLGKSIYDDTSLIEQSKSLQDSVNKTKRNIADNSSDNGVLAGSGDFIDKKVLEAYTGAPDEKIWIKSGDVRQALMRLEPKQIAVHTTNDLNDSKTEIDNIFGSHSTTRGEVKGSKTLGEAQLLRTGDMGRIDLMSRALDRVSQEWYTAMLHMLFVFTTTPKEMNSNDEEGTSLIFDRTQFIAPETGGLMKIIVKVKPGSAMSIDKDARRAEAMELATGKLMDPITFYERMDYSNPRKMAERLFLWSTNPIVLFPELLAQQQAQEAATAEAERAVAENEANANVDKAANTPLPEGTVVNLPTNQPAAAP